MTAAFKSYDVEYLRVGELPLLARVYEPLLPGPLPALVDVHGGVWIGEDRFQNASIHEELAVAGVVVVALDFQLAPAARYPEPVAEINYGIRWVKAHAAELRTRPDLVGGFGTSSGGHQLMLNVLRPSDARYAAIEPANGPAADLRYAIVGWGVLDPLARFGFAQARGNERLIEAHRAYWPSKPAMSEGNPQRILEEAEKLGPLPPLLLLQGTNDDNLPADTAERFAAAYRAAGGDVTLEVFEGQRHTFVTKEPDTEASMRAKQLILEFIQRHGA